MLPVEILGVIILLSMIFVGDSIGGAVLIVLQVVTVELGEGDNKCSF